MNTTIKLILAALLVCTAVTAQTGSTAQINGTVRDASGLAVPGSEIRATQTATGLGRTTVSNADGTFVLTSLPIGPYQLEVAKGGFSKYLQSGILLQVDSNPTVEVTLKVGAVNDQVTVQADAALVETHSTGIGTVVDNQRVVEMPLNGRNATELVFLAGMATTANSGTQPGALNTVRNYPTALISVAGGVGNGMVYLLDGANHNDANNNLNLPLPFPDALQEFKVESSALPAQYGIHSAATVNAVTKSGTNAFHGDAFEFLRNGDFNARDFFALRRDTLKRSQYGGTAGGRVIKDKLFFFAGYQGTRQRSDPPQLVAYTPTAAMLNGDFSTIASAACNAKPIVLPAALGFVNNQIAPSLFNASALKIDSRLPVATDPCGKVGYGLRQDLNEDLGVARIDYQKSDKHSIFVRTTVANLDQPTTFNGKDLLTVNANAAHDRVYTLAAGDTYLIGANIVNSFRVSANRTELPKILDNTGGWPDYGINANSFAGPIISMSVSGNGFAIGGGSSIVNIANTGPNPSFSDDVSWIRGNHQFGFGLTYIHQLINYQSGINATGSFAFNGSVSGMPLADFLLGDAATWHQGNISKYYNRSNYIGLYAQDSWKATPRLTLNLGVRFEPYTAVTSKFGWFDHFDSGNFTNNIHRSVYPNAPAGEIYPGDPQYLSGNSPHNGVYGKVVPRIGLVWDPNGDGKMTIRAAYGMFTDRPNLASLTAFAQDAPYGNNISLSNVNLSTPWATYPGGNPLPLALTKNIVYPTFGTYVTHPFDTPPTYMHQWNVSVQRQVGTDWLLTVNYLGNSTIHMPTGNQINPAVFLGLGACTINGTTYPVCSTTANQNQRRVLYLENPAQGQYYAGLTQRETGGTASYEGLLVSAQKRLSNGVSALANYTWSHCISDYWDDFVGNGGGSAITPSNRRADRSNCQTSDQRQLFNLSVVAQTPKFSNRALRMFASGWQISPLLKIRSAQFFTVTSGVDTALSGQTGQRPNLLNPDPYPANQGVASWVLPSAFGTPALGNYGNLGNYNLKGPGTFQLDMSLTRTFPIREKQTLQLRAEAFNLPNHLNPAVPVSATNSASFGQIQADIPSVATGGLFQSGGDPRVIQFAMKYVF